MGKNGKDFGKKYGTLKHEAVYPVILDSCDWNNHDEPTNQSM